MKKKNYWITVGFIFSFIIITSYYITFEWPEIHPGIGRYFDLIERLAEAIMISCIFYFIVEAFQFYRREQSRIYKADRIIIRIVYSLTELLRVLVANSDYIYRIDEDIFVTDIEVLKYNNNHIFLSPYTSVKLYIGSTVNFLTNGGSDDQSKITNHQACLLLTDMIKNDIEKLECKFDYMDEDVVELLRIIRTLDIFDTVKLTPNNDIFQTCMITRAYEIYELYYYYEQFVNRLKRLKKPYKIDYSRQES